jgi:hypothetical protein
VRREFVSVPASNTPVAIVIVSQILQDLCMMCAGGDRHGFIEVRAANACEARCAQQAEHAVGLQPFCRRLCMWSAELIHA